MTHIYGIKNCDTVKKALKWLQAHKISYIFHDYKKEGAEPEILKRAIKDFGWDTVINKRGTTWRKLPDAVKNEMNAERAIDTALENPSIIKRPLLIHDGKIHIGFSDAQYHAIFTLPS